MDVDEAKLHSIVFMGDCLNVMSQLGKNTVDLVVTDPPYLINYKTNRRKDKSHRFCQPIQNDTLDNKTMIVEYIRLLNVIMKPNTAGYMFCKWTTVDFFKQEIEKYFTIKNIIVWVKNNHTAGDLKGQFGQKYELIILFNKGRKEFNGKRIQDVWFFDKVSSKKAYHQNEKPVDLLKQCIEKHSQRNDLVFDGFAGSGSLGVACKELGRRYILVELDKDNCDIIKNRLRDSICDITSV